MHQIKTLNQLRLQPLWLPLIHGNRQQKQMTCHDWQWKLSFLIINMIFIACDYILLKAGVTWLYLAQSCCAGKLNRKRKQHIQKQLKRKKTCLLVKAGSAFSGSYLNAFAAMFPQAHYMKSINIILLRSESHSLFKQ